MIIKNGNIIMPDKVLFGTDIKIMENRIVKIDKNLIGDVSFDATGLFVCPGFVDEENVEQYKSADIIDENTLAESFRALHQKLKNLVEECDSSLVEAVRKVSLTPATAVGMDNEIGSIEVGKRADIFIMNRDFKEILTIVNGKAV